MAGRRSDTRERIQAVALELFVEQGYDGTSLREIADRLELTKAALYYHFSTKEAIVRSLVDDYATAFDELLEWADGRSANEVLQRFATLVAGRFALVMRFIQENIPAVKQLKADVGMTERMKKLFVLIRADTDDPAAHLRARLALVAVMLGNDEVFFNEVGLKTGGEVALQVALELVSPRENPAGRAT
jgi:AcrR family transcriptional regulator